MSNSNKSPDNNQSNSLSENPGLQARPERPEQLQAQPERPEQLQARPERPDQSGALKSEREAFLRQKGVSREEFVRRLGGASGKEGFPAYRPIPNGVKPKEANPNKARRALWHDYCAPGCYPITATMDPEIDRTLFRL